jgi:hypothetical protein
LLRFYVSPVTWRENYPENSHPTGSAWHIQADKPFMLPETTPVARRIVFFHGIIFSQQSILNNHPNSEIDNPL